MSRQRDTVIHLVAGGVAGTVGAIVTCPLEVVKTRLQSSTHEFCVQKISVGTETLTSRKSLVTGVRRPTCLPPRLPSMFQRRRVHIMCIRHSPHMLALAGCGGGGHRPVPTSMGLLKCLRLIVEQEGPRALFKGLGPNLVGVAPSRAIYFCAYSQAKTFFNSVMNPDTAYVHCCAASCAGFVACTATNPIWFVKTRLQLDYARHGRMTAMQCIRRIYRQKGLIGFYKGITASYFGISETVVHFVIYEAIKANLAARRKVCGDVSSTVPACDSSSTSPDTSHAASSGKSSKDFVEFMLAGAVSKTVASCIAYPHEVARTRLREEGNKYHSFWQTIFTVSQEEGYRGLYRGLTTQLVRQIPNTAIMMATYEAVVYVLTKYCGAPANEFYGAELEKQMTQMSVASQRAALIEERQVPHH